MKAGTRAELALAGVTVIWGTTFVLVKSALGEVSTFLFLALRFSVAAVALAILYKGRFRRKSIMPGLFAGCLLFAAYVFQTAGLETDDGIQIRLPDRVIDPDGTFLRFARL